MYGGTHFPGKFCPTGQEILSASRIICPPGKCSLALPDPLRTGAYRLEIISAALRGSGTIHRPKMNKDLQVLLAVDWNPFKKVLNSLGVDC